MVISGARQPRPISRLLALSDNGSFFFGNGRGNRLAGDDAYRIEVPGASFKSVPALDAQLLVDDVDQALASLDPVSGALPEAEHAGPAMRRIEGSERRHL